MKKKLTAIALIVALLAVAVIGGTLAYFNDAETATNTFTVGKVDITLKETDNEGKPFKQDQKLLPGSNSANAIAKNAVVTVEEKSEDSWVWVEVLIPAELYNSKTQSNETNNALHYNQFINFLQGYTGISSNVNAVECAETYTDADHQWSLMEYVGESEDGKYSILRTTHEDIVKAGETTSPAVNQFYMDNDVYYDAKEGCYMIPKDGKAADPAKEFVEYTGDWEVIINAYAIQAAGIADVDAAVAAYAKQGK